VLFYFKYSNFALEMIQSVTRGTFSFREILLPLGISFFTFQQIMYVSSVGKGEIRVNLPDYLAYILFFPKLIMGPLMEPTEFIRQINDPERKNISWENMASGLKLFSFGLCKKMLLADTFARAVAWGFANGTATAGKLPVATSYDLLLVMLSYTFQIYFDFSGYSDMATGVSKMLNIDLPVNFDSPYKAASLRDFWRRWHNPFRFSDKIHIYPTGREPERFREDLRKYHDCFPDQRIMAWSELDLCALGISSRTPAGAGTLFQQNAEKTSRVYPLGVYFLFCEYSVASFQGGKHPGMAGSDEKNVQSEIQADQ